MKKKKCQGEGDMGQVGSVNEVMLNVNEEGNIGYEQKSIIKFQKPKKWTRGEYRSPIIMSTISWNCHWLGTQWALQFLKEVTLQKHPNYIFLCETLCKKNMVEKMRLMLGFDGMISVDAEGHKCGLALLRRNKGEVTLCSFNKNRIDVIMTTRENNKYRLTRFYSEPDRSKDMKHEA